MYQCSDFDEGFSGKVSKYSTFFLSNYLFVYIRQKNTNTHTYTHTNMNTHDTPNYLQKIFLLGRYGAVN